MTSVHLERPRTDRAPRAVRWFLLTNRWWARLIINLRYRVVIHGADNVPSSGPVVFAANHVGIIDGPLLAIYSPRPAHALTKLEMFRGPLGPFLWLAGQIKLDRFHTDPRAVKTAVRALREGQAVGIFPEGTRGTGELERFHRGAGYLALVTGAPVVPVIVFGTREPGGSSSSLPHKGATLDLVYGRPVAIEPQPWPRTQTQVADASRLLRDRMLIELEEARRLTGRSLPGPLPAGQHEPDPGGGITEKSA